MEMANTRIGEWLGLQPPATEAEILRLVEGRLAPSVIKRLAALGFERGEIDQTVISSRTLQHRRHRREKLTVEESDRVFRIIRVLASAESVYGSRERALGMAAATSSSTGRTVSSFTAQDRYRQSYREELLIQIDEGMFV